MMLVPTGFMSSTPVPGMILWLQADNGVVDIGGIPCVDNGSVAGWKDQSGRGHHAAVTGGAPIFHTNQIQGYPTVRLDGSGKAIVVPSGAFADIIAAGYFFTLFIVLKPNTLMVTYTAVSDSANRNISIWIGNGYWQCFNILSQNYTSTWTTGVPQLLTYQANSISRNGTVLDTHAGTPTAGSTTDTWHFGDNPSSPNASFDGDYCEIIAYPKALSTADIAQTQAYLKQRWSF